MILAIYGAGGLGKEIAELAEANNDNCWAEVVFVDDTEGGPKEKNGIRVLKYEDFKATFSPDNARFIIAQGEPIYRELLYNKVKADNYKLEVLIDKSARVSRTAEILEGTVICENATIHVNTKIGHNCLIQPMSVIGHDTVIGNHVVLSAFCAPGGKCVFEDRSYVGMSTTILQGLTIGHDAIVGMGSVVYRDVEADTTVLGNPARITKGKDEHRVFS